MSVPSTAVRADIVVPSIGRSSLAPLLAALKPQLSLLGGGLIVVDDRPAPHAPLDLPEDVTVLHGAGHGPAAARNLGADAATAPWIAFLDDDVLPDRGWAESLLDDLGGLPEAVAASQGRIRVPLPRDRRPSDSERNVAGLEGALWISADLACRRDAFATVGGFDERFAGAYREDTDLALRLLAAGWRIARGSRTAAHPVAPADFWVSVRRQRGNADDVLMRALHGRHWRHWGGAPPGRLRRHITTSIFLGGAAAAAITGRRRPSIAFAVAWLGASAELAAARILSGPRDPREIKQMVATSAVLPLAASGWWAAGVAGLPARLLRGGPRPISGPRRGAGSPCPGRSEAVLLDRDGTVLIDIPYNGDPELAVPVPGAKAALARLREANLPLAVVSNQSGIARGTIGVAQVRAVNQRAERMLGPIDEWLFCPHGPDEGCECRKPAPGMIVEAAERLGVRPERCAVVGDIAADVQAAQAAGAIAILVPTERTEAEDVRRAPLVASSLAAAVDLLLGAEANAGATPPLEAAA